MPHEQLVAPMLSVDVKTTRKYVLVNLELRAIHELNASVNRVFVKAQPIVEIELFAKPTSVDLSVIMMQNVLTMKNVPTVSVHPLVKLMKLVLLVLFANQVNVKLVADLMPSVHLLVLV